MSWPKKLDDIPSFAHFPAKENGNGELEIEYKEGFGVRYRNESDIRDTALDSASPIQHSIMRISASVLLRV